MAGPEAEDLPGVSLSLRAQLTIWFALSFGVILATIVAGVVVLDHGRLFQPASEQYDWLIRLVGISFLAALAGGIAAAWVIVGAALDPLRRITEAARVVAPERIDATRVDMPEVGVEVNEARRELNSALDRIEAGYQAQERFISNVSHELKTPIAVLLTEARRLRMRERSPEELKEFVDDVADQMARLGKIVESFLTLARIDYEERLQKNEEFWFHDVLLEAVSRSRAQALTHDVHIDLELPEDTELFDHPSWGDPELVSSMVENLIRNAIRFSPRSSSVHVWLSAAAGPEGPGDDARDPARVNGAATGGDPPHTGAVIRVRDEGPGMPQELIATVFEPFAQADSERGTGRGTGLGLAIAHKVATLHRGTIRAYNRTDGRSGCTVEVQLPFLVAEDWSADREVTADLPVDGIGSGMRAPRLEPGSVEPGE
ncbi:MAG: HAMP domain-containing sensor histidine kinase [Planctomycetota bacterium]